MRYTLTHWKLILFARTQFVSSNRKICDKSTVNLSNIKIFIPYFFRFLYILTSQEVRLRYYFIPLQSN